MGSKSCRIWSFLVFAVMVSRGGRGESAGCSNNMISGLSSCISYLRGNSSRPLPSCCASLANVQQAQPECICPMLTNNGASATLGTAINRTLAMAMPATCKLPTPQCHDDVGNGGAASSPAVSPPSDASSPSPPSTAEAPTSDFDSGSKTVPVPNIDTSDATTSSIYLIFMAAWIIATSHFQY
ncbi:non-specific lipid transfer protein GPI-anchored 5-like [Salvia miltiorrhiza]|uniref:non-specific lipid transfer protein GPI-anchored 5-like n=1 Tax=Salvia miltiorrhiza TaxID=226208 RepID=UPI0025AC0422|nr:non-specific lipid transfer protein GPI-anchored 5-like [Salvia miltiorrhiza]